MIQANELRIGNLIISKRHQDLQTDIFGLTPTKLMLSANPLCYYDPADVEPIPLTEEWLLRFGATPNVNEPGHKVRLGATNMTVRINAGKAYAEIPGLYIGELKGVHHLQNIVAALTGQELTLKS